jgi:uncharacterized membrane protein YphA (DoxX/SURF4 family)
MSSTLTYKHLVKNPVSIAPLLTFRIGFGVLILISTLRFILKGWITEFYITPQYFFTYYGFDFIHPLSQDGMFIVFILMVLGALGIVFGLLYRFSALLFFITFTYAELIDKTNYLNHYYFVSIVAFMLIFLPAGKAFAIDNLLFKKNSISHIPAWTVNCLKLMIGIVYFYAGIAKINPDWLLEALPLKIWLQARYDYPIIGNMLTEKWVAYFFSWAGCIFDCTIFFFLIHKRTRSWAYFIVIIFHLLTRWLFPIGMFPYIMILAASLFFSDHVHKKILRAFGYKEQEMYVNIGNYPTLMGICISTLIIFQLLFPWRYLFYPGNLFWTEEGYRFSWRVMLMEKAAYTNFVIKDINHPQGESVDNYSYLTPYQIKMMSTQPDMILQYAHFLRDVYERKGYEQPEVYAISYASVNGKGSRIFVDSTRNLSLERESFKPKTWILDYEK